MLLFGNLLYLRAQAVFAGFLIGNTPTQCAALELLACFGLVLAHLLHGGRANLHAIALAGVLEWRDGWFRCNSATPD